MEGRIGQSDGSSLSAVTSGALADFLGSSKDGVTWGLLGLGRRAGHLYPRISQSLDQAVLSETAQPRQLQRGLTLGAVWGSWRISPAFICVGVLGSPSQHPQGAQ